MPSIGWLKFGPKIKVSRSVGSFVQSKRWLKSVPKDKPWRESIDTPISWIWLKHNHQPWKGVILGWFPLLFGVMWLWSRYNSAKRIELRGKWNRTFSQNPRSFSSPWGVWTCPVPGWSLHQRLNFEGQPETTPCWDSGWSRHQRSHVEDSRVNSPCPSSDCICHQMSGFPCSCKSCLRNPTLRSGDQDNPWSLPMLLYMGYKWYYMKYPKTSHFKGAILLFMPGPCCPLNPRLHSKILQRAYDVAMKYSCLKFVWGLHNYNKCLVGTPMEEQAKLIVGS